MGGGLAIHGVQRGRQRKGRAGAGEKLAFEAVAMQVDDTGQDKEAREIDRRQALPLRALPRDDLACRNPDETRNESVAGQDLGTGQAERGQERRHGEHPEVAVRLWITGPCNMAMTIYPRRSSARRDPRRTMWCRIPRAAPQDRH